MEGPKGVPQALQASETTGSPAPTSKPHASSNKNQTPGLHSLAQSFQRPEAASLQCALQDRGLLSNSEGRQARGPSEHPVVSPS